MLARIQGTAYLGYHFLRDRRCAFRRPEEVRRDQSRRVRRIIEHAFRFVPYYRETLSRLGLVPSDFRSSADLARLPILERRQIQSDPERFLSTARSWGGRRDSAPGEARASRSP